MRNDNGFWIGHYFAGPCSYCEGVGHNLHASALGLELRHQREATGITARLIAQRMRLSAQYVNDLEQGRRRWTLSLAERYRQALQHES